MIESGFDLGNFGLQGFDACNQTVFLNPLSNVRKVFGGGCLINIFEFIAPALGQLLGDNIANIIRARGPVTGIALLGLIWSGSTVFNTLNQTLNDIWGIKRARPVWARRGLAILLVLALAGPALLLASFASSLIAPLRQWLPEQIPFIRPGVSFTVALLLDMLLLMVLYMLLPHGAASWRELLPGAVGAGLLWELAKKAFLMFVSSYVTASNLVYGSVAAILAFLIWSYASGLIFLFGAYLSCAVYHHKNPAT